MSSSLTYARELLQQLHATHEAGPRPRIAALHLPPRPWSGTKSGEFGAIELDSGALGLSYVLLDDTLATIDDAGAAVVGADALDVAGWWAEGGGARAALGFAAANALSRQVFDAAGFVPPRATDSLGGIDPQPGEHIGMVGFFPPLVKQVTARGARLTVLERRADLAGEHADWRVSLDAADLATCTQVLSTSTVLLNHSLDEVLAHCTAARRIVLIGPSAGGLPDGLFARGVTAVGGVWIDDAEAFRQALVSGEPWGAATWKFVLARGDYPGLDTLRQRAARRAGSAAPG